MAKNIERTPTLTGSSAKEFLEDMKRPDSPKEEKIKRGLMKLSWWNFYKDAFFK